MKLRKKVTEKILQYLRAGSYIETAVVAAGVRKSTYYNWLAIVAEERKRIELAEAKGETYDLAPEYAKLIKFVDATEKAMAEAEIFDLAQIRKASETSWQASAWRLERKFPQKWGVRQHVELTGKDGGPLRHEFETALERAYGGQDPEPEPLASSRNGQ